MSDRLGIPESTRWRDGKAWLCNWGAGEVLAVTPDGEREVTRAPRRPSLAGKRRARVD